MWRRRSNRPDNHGCESEAVRAAREAAERAERERRRAEAKEPQARRIGGAIRDALERNGFGETIDIALSRRAGT